MARTKTAATPAKAAANTAAGSKAVERYRAILETSARLICQKGYDGTSIQEIAEACGLTKAGLYHHIESKEHLLAAIMDYGMDLFEEQVLTQVRDIEDPVARLKACMEKNIKLVTHGWSKEITIILHEHSTLHGPAGKHINARKKKYVRFLESSFAEAVKRGLIRPVNPTVAAFAFLGMVLWIYKWFQPTGKVSDHEITEGMIDLLFTGLVVAPTTRGAAATKPAQPRGKKDRK